MLVAALFWGSVWGLGEATLGHVLHLVRVPGLPGLVMVPFAVLIMGRLAVRSRSAGAVFLAGAVAAGFKFFDLLVPGTDILALSRPIQAILLEALAAAVWIKPAKMGTFLFFPAEVKSLGPEKQKRPHFEETGWS
jgi:hypothetical protein